MANPRNQPQRGAQVDEEVKPGQPSPLAQELLKEAAANDGTSLAGVVVNTGDKPDPVVPLPGAGTAGVQGEGAGVQAGARLDVAPNRPGAPDPNDRKRREDEQRAPSQTEIASWRAFGEAHGLFALLGFVLASGVAATAVPAQPKAAPIIGGATPTRPELSPVSSDPSAPPCPDRDEAGDKDRAFFVWQCRYGDLEAVKKNYIGRKIASELIDEQVILRVRRSHEQ